MWWGEKFKQHHHQWFGERVPLSNTKLQSEHCCLPVVLCAHYSLTLLTSAAIYDYQKVLLSKWWLSILRSSTTTMAEGGSYTFCDNWRWNMVITVFIFTTTTTRAFVNCQHGALAAILVCIRRWQYTTYTCQDSFSHVCSFFAIAKVCTSYYTNKQKKTLFEKTLLVLIGWKINCLFILLTIVIWRDLKFI